MDDESQIDALTALGHAGRLAVFRLLARRAPDGVRPREIAAALGLKPSTLSVHLATLARAGLVASEREGQAVRYRIDAARVGKLIDYLFADCCRGRPELCLPGAGTPPLRRPDGAPWNVLFLCSGNSARSQIAEAVLNREGQGRFRAFSAGTRPAAAVNPQAVDILRQLGHDVAVLQPKGHATFQRPGAPEMDLVITLCDSAADADCPAWPGHPLTSHWGMPDPAAAEGGETAVRAALIAAYRTLSHRIAGLVALPAAELDRPALVAALDRIGRSEPQPLVPGAAS